MPAAPGQPGQLDRQARDLDVLLTAETHNFPCAVAPYPGGLADPPNIHVLHAVSESNTVLRAPPGQDPESHGSDMAAWHASIFLLP